MIASSSDIKDKIPPPPFFKGGEETKKGSRGVGAEGYTLVEVIATIVVTAILGVIFVNFMGVAVSRSANPVDNVQGEAAAEAVLERIIADYVIALNALDTSATNQQFVDALASIRTAINGGTYGANIRADYVTFDTEGNMTVLSSGTSRTLKVTVNAPGIDLTTLLTQSRDKDSPKIAF